MFDTHGCVAEYFTTKSAGAAFAVVMNAYHGICGSNTPTDGASEHPNRGFWDAVFNPHLLPDGVYRYYGAANQYSKHRNIFRLDEPWMRWCLYESNLFGHPSLPIPAAP
jgi:hypothetical protein